MFIVINFLERNLLKCFFCQFHYNQRLKKVPLYFWGIKPLTFPFTLAPVITQNPQPFRENVHRKHIQNCERRQPWWKKIFFLWLFLLSVMKAKTGITKIFDSCSVCKLLIILQLNCYLWSSCCTFTRGDNDVDSNVYLHELSMHGQQKNFFGNYD